MIINDKLGAHGDDAYAALLAVHEGLSTDESHALNARLVLVLMNEVGNLDRLKHLLAEARALSSC